MSSSRFILLGVRKKDKSTHFYIHTLFQALSGDNWFNLQQCHTAFTLISSWDIWGNWGSDSKVLPDGTHVVKGGVRLAFQDWICCGVFADRIKLIWGPSMQSMSSGIQSGKLVAWEVKGSDKWFLTLEDLRESKKPMAFLPQSSALSFLYHTHSEKYTHIPKSDFHRQ